MTNNILKAFRNWDERIEQAEFSVKALAGGCHVSERQLERYFLSEFRATPHACINQRRLRLGMHYLKLGLSVKETAYLLNYAHASHFSAAFNRFYGKPPSAVMSNTLVGRGTKAGK